MHFKIAFIGMVVFLLGCDKSKFSSIATIELPDHEPKLSVMAILTNTYNNRNAFVSHSKAILDSTNYDLIRDANVKLYNENGELVTLFTWNENSERYHSSGHGQTIESGEYRMEVSAPGFETIQAFQRLPKNPNIINAEYFEDALIDVNGNVKDLLEIEIEDDGSEDNFYHIGVYASGTKPHGSLFTSIYGYSDDPLKEFGWREEFIPDYAFNGGKYKLRFLLHDNWQDDFDIDDGGEIDKIHLQVISYSKDYYQFSTSVVNFKKSQFLPFVEPVILFSNWDNGYGIFSLTNVAEYEFDF